MYLATRTHHVQFIYRSSNLSLPRSPTVGTRPGYLEIGVARIPPSDDCGPIGHSRAKTLRTSCQLSHQRPVSPCHETISCSTFLKILTFTGYSNKMLPFASNTAPIMEISGNLSSTSAILQERILSLLDNSPPQHRIIIALAGVPGSGKSTIAANLLAYLKQTGIHNVVVTPMVSSIDTAQECHCLLLTLKGWLSLHQSDLVHICRSR